MKSLSYLQEMMEDCIIRSDMERLNGNQVILGSSKRNEEAVMKPVDLKQKEVWVCGFFFDEKYEDVFDLVLFFL